MRMRVVVEEPVGGWLEGAFFLLFLGRVKLIVDGWGWLFFYLWLGD